MEIDYEKEKLEIERYKLLNEQKKLILEQSKIDAEREKNKYLAKNFFLDCVSKAGIPLGLVLIGLGTLKTNQDTVEHNRMVSEQQIVLAKQKNEDEKEYKNFLINKDISDRKMNFFANNRTKILSSKPEDIQEVRTLIEEQFFDSQTIRHMNNKVDSIRKIHVETNKTQYPEMAELLNKIGKNFVNQGNFIDAEERFSLAVDLTPENVEILNNLGYVKYRNNKLEQAKFIFDKIINLRNNGRQISFDLDQKITINRYKVHCSLNQDNNEREKIREDIIKIVKNNLVVQELKNKILGDVELLRVCGFNVLN